MRLRSGQKVVVRAVGVILAALVGSSGGQVAAHPQVAKSPPGVEISNEILQRKDKDLRQRRINEVLAALQNPDADLATKQRMLLVLNAVANVPFDRAPFLPVVKGLLNDSVPAVRAAALGVMPTVGAGEGDLAAMARLAVDPAPEVRQVVVSALEFTKSETKDATLLPVVDKLLDDLDPEVNFALASGDQPRTFAQVYPNACLSSATKWRSVMPIWTSYSGTICAKFSVRETRPSAGPPAPV